MPSPFHSTKKEFILHSQGEDSYVEVTPSHTLSDVRRLILEEFDTEQLPCKQTNATDTDGTCESTTNEADVEFAFRVNGIRISAKQEARKNAFDLLARGVKVELVPKKVLVHQKRKAEEEEGESADLSVRRSVKRVKMGGAGAVTPFEPEIEGGVVKETHLGEGGREDEEVQDIGEDDKSTMSTQSASGGSVIAPLQLDDKFASSANSENDDGNDSQNESLGGGGRDDSHATMNMNMGDNEMNPELETGTNEKVKATSSKEDQGERDSAMRNENDESESIEDSVEKDSMDLELRGEKMLAKKNDSMDDIMLAELDDSITFGKKRAAADDNMAEDLSTISAGQKKSADDILDDIDYLETSISKKKTDDSNDDILEVTNDNNEGENTIANINPHKVSDEAKEKSRHVLSQLANILKDNPNFCVRTKEWLDDIKSLTEKSSPQTVFGVLGNTGVGKSSLLNGLLDEAAVLPTSGSRGCTAAVVELVFHSELLEKAKHDSHDVNASADEPTVPVYRGEVEFITLEDWRKELKTLVDECSTQEKTIYALPPQEDAMPDAAASWQKIEQVYGKRSMDQYCRKSTDYVYHQLAHNTRVKNLLTATNPGQDYNSIIVQAGEVVPGSEDAKELIKGHGQMKSKMKGKKKKWAQEFRKQINSYVYRMGNGDQPQTWPLIRKVELRGPWSVLSTGAVLVDLPGVRDSNAARAKVAESYLQNCNQIAIVAPIKRAVDDGTAKDLLGEQFKRRLLMDGQYGNVFFICTQTDDIEATETMRDHADVAQEVPGRWERMTELSDGINGFESQLYPLLQQEEDLEGQVEDAKQQLKDSLEDLKQAEEEANDDYSDDDDNSSLLENLKGVINESRAAFVKAKEDLASWRDEHSPAIESIQGKCDRLQKKLKALCSTVRNEYSKSCLQEDFKSGLKELYRKDDDDSGSDGNDTQTALPEDFNMEVFCISANDYLKLMKIKPSRDGPPSCFANAHSTQIPILRNYVHETTARFCQSSVKQFVENCNDVLDQMKLLAADVENVPTGRSAFRMKQTFESAMRDLATLINPLARDFQKTIDQKIHRSLASSLKTGAQKGSSMAMSTVASWGSKNRRTKSERRPDKNGLYYSTYNAVARREGVYTSKSAGAIDFNQELCDPMEKEFSTEWQAVLDSTIRRLLGDAEKTILQLCTSSGQSFAQSLRSNGVDAARLSNMLNTANRSAVTAVKARFVQMATVAVNAQRELSRELLPAVQQKMKSTYASVNGVTRGSGTFDRMKGAMHVNSDRAVHGMFDDAMENLMKGIQTLVKQLKTMIESTSDVISKTFDNVFNLCWDDQQSEALISPEQQKAIRECRDKCLPELNALVDTQESACVLLGVEREEVELDVMGVETFDEALKRRKEEAAKNGDMFDLCDSDTELSIKPKNGFKVKAEKKAATSTGKSFASSNMDVIDLCDSDDDEWTKPAAKAANKPSGAVKEEAFL